MVTLQNRFNCLHFSERFESIFLYWISLCLLLLGMEGLHLYFDHHSTPFIHCFLCPIPWREEPGSCELQGTLRACSDPSGCFCVLGFN